MEEEERKRKLKAYSVDFKLSAVLEVIQDQRGIRETSRMNIPDLIEHRFRTERATLPENREPTFQP